MKNKGKTQKKIIKIFLLFIALIIGSNIGHLIAFITKENTHHYNNYSLNKKEIQSKNPYLSNSDIDKVISATSDKSIDKMVKNNNLTKNSSPEEFVKAMADALNKQTPIRIDNFTILNKVSSKGKTISYDYTIEATSNLISTVTKAERMEFIKTNKEFICKEYIDVKWAGEILKDISYVYRYSDLDNNKLMDFTLTKKICEDIIKNRNR